MKLSTKVIQTIEMTHAELALLESSRGNMSICGKKVMGWNIDTNEILLDGEDFYRQIVCID